MKRYLFLLLLVFCLPAAVLAQGTPTMLVPRYFAIENAAQFSQYIFFAVTWDLVPSVVFIDSESDRIGGKNTGSQTTLYFADKMKFNEDSIRASLDEYRYFHEIDGVGSFSYPLKISFTEVLAEEGVAETTNYLRIRDLNQGGVTAGNKEYLILEDTRLVIKKTDGSEQVQNLLVDAETDGKKRLPTELAVFISFALPLLLLWLGLKAYFFFKRKREKQTK